MRAKRREEQARIAEEQRVTDEEQQQEAAPLEPSTEPPGGALQDHPGQDPPGLDPPGLDPPGPDPPEPVPVVVEDEAEGIKLHLSSRNKTGYAGVKHDRHRFNAVYAGRHLGSFATALEAAVAYAMRAQAADEELLREDDTPPGAPELPPPPPVSSPRKKQRVKKGGAAPPGDEEVLTPAELSPVTPTPYPLPHYPTDPLLAVTQVQVLAVVAMSDDDEDDDEEMWGPPPEVEWLPDDAIQVERLPDANVRVVGASSGAPKRRMVSQAPQPPPAMEASVAVELRVTADGGVGMQLNLRMVPGPGSFPRGIARVPLAAPPRRRSSWGLHPFWPAPKPGSGRAAVLEALAAGCEAREEIATYVTVRGERFERPTALRSACLQLHRRQQSQ